ncbi:pyridine nucleotide-disulfide oxidoreductase [Sphaerisporangium rufum]|uniref:Pyridine nucleotide-disulfide oxidoreductase n=1 Tax=Sphaerisporangium rufum TaxID=1381558 RepID=A0A919QYK8_9ACTN|nr:FAD-dependent oxidoreductase [Sphaerisporangium rufum]GII75151.1 pyridine nucleotide-disulfide oxidoreductase [Sphaerisporangium rufum]
MVDILIIGGGFAGVWSAAAAARVRAETGSDLSITLIAPGKDLVIRPRLYEADPDRMRVPLDRFLTPIGVRHVPATVSSIDAGNRTVTAIDRGGRPLDFRYRRLVLATGSRLRPAGIPGAEHLHDVDTIERAVALDRHLRGLPEGPGRRTAVVVGAGFTGLEVATELAGRLAALADPADPADRPRVVLVERAGEIGPDLGPGPRPAIAAALDRLGIEVRLGQSIASVAPGAVSFTDGTELAADTVIWTAGVQASPLTAQIPGRRDALGRLQVDGHLHVPEAPGVLAAGDTAAATAEPGHLVLQCCQHAIPLGKYAGHNAAAGLLGLPLATFDPAPYATCVDLGGAGAVLTSGWERTVLSTGDAAKQRKIATNQERIYPPLDDAAEILRAADYRVGIRPPAARI